MPPTALCSAIERIRRPMCSNSSTRCSELSRMTAPAASAVTSLPCPNAMPTVAAVSAGASLIPSPRNTVGARAVSVADDRQLLLRALAGEHLDDPDALGQVPHLRLPIAGDEQDARRMPCRGSRWRMKGRPSRRGSSRNRNVAA